MDRVNLVFMEDDWILARAAWEIARYIPKISMNGSPGVLNYFINYAQYENMPGASAALYTHLEEKGHWRKFFIDSIPKVDHHIAMCEDTADIVRDYTDKDVHIIHCGVEERRPLRFGVAGRTYKTGRKGEYLIKHMVDEGYIVSALGPGWPCPEVSMTRSEFFEGLDYYVVSSLNEGGPFPVLDALAHGVPVIAPDVGWCWEYSTLRYEKGSWNSLHKVLKGLKPRLWKDWAMDHKKLFEEVLS